MNDALPVLGVLPELRAALAEHRRAVLIAPPGAGKTTGIAPALLEEDWCEGQIWIAAPRRVAARAAAERMAEGFGERAGETVGYLTRLDSRVGARTRIVVMTEAILVNRIVADPELSGVSAILFDEAHERTLDSDVALALALETAGILREDLRLLVMSATIEGSRFAELLGGDAPVVESEGRSHPLELRWLGTHSQADMVRETCAAILQAHRAEPGDILAFLPGVREIERACERLAERLPDTLVLPLHGRIDAVGQRLALQSDAQGRRRIVVASAIAETSLTLDGVRVVVDAGWSREARFDPLTGTTRLETRRASQATATQRAGRAARQGPGVAYRLWEHAGHAGRARYAEPEILHADLAPLRLSLARWGTRDANALPWLDEPPAASLASAEERLRQLDALDEKGGLTAFGETLARLPMHPADGAALLHGAANGCASEVARLIVTMQENRLGGQGEDIAARERQWASRSGKREQAAAKLAKRWASLAEAEADAPAGQLNAAQCLALSRVGNLARRRSADGERWHSVSGRGFVLDPTSPLAREEWVLVCNAQGQAKGARITDGIALSAEEVREAFEDRFQTELVARWNEDAGRVDAFEEVRLGAIVLERRRDVTVPPDSVLQVLRERVLSRLGDWLPADLLARARFAGIDAFASANLSAQAAMWLEPLLKDRRDIDVPLSRRRDALLNLLDWEIRRALDRDAPLRFRSPAGTDHTIDYTGDDAPSVEVRVQALYGLDRHPLVGRTPLLLKLTSPAGRPVQATRDLPAFWRGSWADVRKDMKGRYPKHRWPEEPWSAAPSLKTKNAFEKSVKPT